MPARKIRLNLQEEIIVREILQTYLPGREVWVFGSRIGDNPKQYSDLDLLVRDDAPLPAATLYALKEAFEESNLPFQVDIVEWATTSERFRQIIAANYLPIQHAKV
jgi:predicted nucleotidyltransferase